MDVSALRACTTSCRRLLQGTLSLEFRPGTFLFRFDLPVLHFHSLRHSCASFLLAQGVPARVVMEILGHSDIRLTLNTYSHVGQELQDEAARQISAVLWSGAKA